MSDCATLLASESTLECTIDILNWSADVGISDWDGVITENNRVTELMLNDYRLPGEIPAALSNLANLGWLNLYQNELTGEIPSELGNFANLESLELNGNQLTGAIPSELGNLANLMELNLRDNQLTGAIPPQLSNLANLDTLWIGENKFTGAIPSQLGNLANLEWLYLGNNELTGEIPPELGNLANLRTLDLYNNQLTGEIPPELGNLSNLRTLDLQENQITGCIPRSLRAPLGDSQIESLGLPFCDGSSVPPPAPTPVRPPSATATPTPTPTATPTASGDVMDRLTTLERQGAELAGVKEQVSALSTRVARLEGASAIAPPTPTPTATPSPTPSATPVTAHGATPSPTPTSVAGTSGGNACVTELTGSANVSGSWSAACLSASSPNNRPYYARFYTFTLSATSEATITLSSADAAPYLYLLNGAGTGGAINRETGSGASSAAITTTLQPGAYTIEATTWDDEDTGDFTLTLTIAQP